MMPPKRCGTLRRATTRGAVAASGSQAKCDLCLANIVEGKDEALQCEAACQQWFHRYCAGVSQTVQSPTCALNYKADVLPVALHVLRFC